MFITKNGLKKMFALSAVSLYAVGLGVTLTCNNVDSARIYNDLVTLRELKRNFNDVVIENGGITSIGLTIEMLKENNNQLDSCLVDIDFRQDKTVWFEFTFTKGVHQYDTDGDFDGASLVFNLSNAYSFNETYLSLDTAFYPYDSDGHDTLLINLSGENDDYIVDYEDTATTSNWLVNNSLDGTYNEFSYDFIPFFLVRYAFDNQLSAQYYNQGYAEGINHVIENLSDYDLYTYSQYLAYGQQRYNAGVNDSASSDVLSMSGVMETIFASPVTMFTQIFGSDAFRWTMPNGNILDLGGLMTFLLTIGIALAVVRLIMKIGGK